MGGMRRIRYSLAGLAIILAGSSLVFHFVEGRGFFTSLYFAVTTLTTTGLGDVIPRTAAGRVTTVLTLIIGVVLIGLLVGSVTEILVEGQVRRILGRKKLEKKIAALSGHYIVCGFGRIGAVVCRELHESGVPFMVIEHDAEALAKADEEGYIYLRGDATDDDILVRAGILRARGLVSVLATDADNVYVTMSARDLNRRLLIVARGETERTMRKLSRAGANKVISPGEIGGMRMAHAILRPNVIDFIEAATRSGTEIDMEEVKITGSSPLAGRTLLDSGIRRDFGLIIVAIRKPDGRMTFNPSSEAEIEAGDVLITMGPAANQKRLAEACRRAAE